MNLLRDSLREKARQILVDEVLALCGPSYEPKPGSEFRRAGSEAGFCHFDGKREEILRPRVRRKANGNGSETEHFR
jgi:hypothetical protein